MNNIDTNFIINIDGINVTITQININNITSQVGYFNRPGQIHSYRHEISINGEISNNDYFKLDKWFNGMLNASGYLNLPPSRYKKDIIYNGIQMCGLFPTDYSFNQNCIDVTFSVDYFSGDLKLFQLKELRKAKLNKLNKL
jgi:hypothetical protein